MTKTIARSSCESGDFKIWCFIKTTYRSRKELLFSFRHSC